MSRVPTKDMDILALCDEAAVRMGWGMCAETDGYWTHFASKVRVQGHPVDGSLGSISRAHPSAWSFHLRRLPADRAWLASAHWPEHYWVGEDGTKAAYSIEVGAEGLTEELCRLRLLVEVLRAQEDWVVRRRPPKPGKAPVLRSMAIRQSDESSAGKAAE